MPIKYRGQAGRNSSTAASRPVVEQAPAAAVSTPNLLTALTAPGTTVSRSRHLKSGFRTRPSACPD